MGNISLSFVLFFFYCTTFLYQCIFLVKLLKILPSGYKQAYYLVQRK